MNSIDFTQQCSLADLPFVLLEERKDKTAVIDSHNEQSICYSELDEQVNKTIKVLERLGLEKGDIVLVEANKQIATLIIALAIMKLKAVFAPIDPQTPALRLKKIIQVCQAKFAFVTSKEQQIQLIESDFKARSEMLSELRVFEAKISINTWNNELDPLAYIIFTSGSTGTPKGVQISHKAALNFLNATQSELKFDENMRYLNVSPLYFDASILDVFMSLSLGACLVLLPPVVFPSQITEALEKYRITDTLLVSSVLKMLVSDYSDIHSRDLSSLKLIWYGAESCSTEVLQKIKEALPQVSFVHGYGPTETTHTALFYLFDDIDHSNVVMPLGYPLKGLDLLVLDETGSKVERNGKGELLISGPQLMRAYINDQEKTQSSLLSIDGKIYYKTNDVVRIDEEGKYYFVGRKDDAVKIQGKLVHLGEIEQCALQIKGVMTAIARSANIISMGTSHNQLFLLIDAEPNISIEDIEEHIHATLPDYMQPREIVIVERMENYRLPSGKVDRRKMEAVELTDLITKHSDDSVAESNDH